MWTHNISLQLTSLAPKVAEAKWVERTILQLMHYMLYTNV